MTDDEFDMILKHASKPPGNFAVMPSAPMLLVVGQQATMVKQLNGFDNASLNVAEADAKARQTASVWGSKRKQKKEASYTTVVIKNLPEKCTNMMVLELLDTAGFGAQYDFVRA